MSAEMYVKLLYMGLLPDTKFSKLFCIDLLLIPVSIKINFMWYGSWNISFS